VFEVMALHCLPEIADRHRRLAAKVTPGSVSFKWLKNIDAQGDQYPLTVSSRELDSLRGLDDLARVLASKIRP
jgi:hypothetical protein